jgi:hypothetical protein
MSCIFKKIIRLRFASLEEKMKIDHVIREDKNKNEDDDSPLIKLNSNFEFTNI